MGYDTKGRQTSYSHGGASTMSYNAIDLPLLYTKGTTSVEWKYSAGGVKLQKRTTDPVDSAKLARGLCSGELEGIYIPDREAQEIRSLTRLRDLMTKARTRQKNSTTSHLRFFGTEIPERFSRPGFFWSSAFIRWMRSLEEFKGSGKETLEFLISHYEAIRQERLEMLKSARTIARSEKYDRKIQLLMSVPGIGQITAMGLLSEIIDIERFSNAEHLASYIGMIPMCHCSGAHDENGDITVRRNGRLRASMIEASWIAIRDDEALLSCYEDYCKRMKPSKAIVKIARKLVNRIYYVMKHDTEYVTGVVQ